MEGGGQERGERERGEDQKGWGGVKILDQSLTFDLRRTNQINI